MVRIRQIWLKFRASRSGWVVTVTLFAISFALFASVLAGIMGLPWLIGATSEDTDVALGIIFPVVILGLAIIFALYLSKRRGVGVFELLGWKRPKKNVFWLLPLTLLVYLVLLVVALSVLQAFSPELAEQEQEVATMVSSMGGWRLVAMVISVGILTPVAEETLFRGLLMSLYARKLKFPLAILFTSILFALAHAQLNIGIDTFFFGLTLGFLSWKTESIYPSIGLHMLKNCLALSVILS